MVVVAGGVCSHIETVSQAVPAGYVAGSLAAYENQERNGTLYETIQG